MDLATVTGKEELSHNGGHATVTGKEELPHIGSCNSYR